MSLTSRGLGNTRQDFTHFLQLISIQHTLNIFPTQIKSYSSGSLQSSYITTLSTDMSTDLLRPPAHLSEADALALSQQAPSILRKQSTWSLPWPFSLMVANDAPERWTVYENLLFSCLRTGDNRSAHICLDKLRERFGDTNERVMGLTGIYHEAVAPDTKALEHILKQYEEAIVECPTNMTVRKRHVALLKSLNRRDGAIAALVDLLDISPIDAEAWSELAELYYAQRLHAQAIYCLEEVLLITPNAWNIHARLGEMLYILSGASSTSESAATKELARSLKSFCRSVELCEDYLRGFYGMKLVTTKMRQHVEKGGGSAVSKRDQSDDEIALPSLETVQKLNELATMKLAEIIRKASTVTVGWEGYSEAEVIAARELLNRDTSSITR